MTSPLITSAPRYTGSAPSPRAYLEGCLARVEAAEPVVQALAAMDARAARNAADTSETRWRTGRPLSAIDGMPVALKDIFETADLPTGFGSPIFTGWRGGRDSAIAYALREAGAVILAKAATTEFAGAAPGPTRNPHHPARTPGGSSSGSAAAVAAGMVPVAIGSQVGGSILRPASFCGVIGYKPTFGALNRGGISDHFSQNCAGTLSSNLADAWAVCHEIAWGVGGDPGFPPLRRRPNARAGTQARHARRIADCRMGNRRPAGPGSLQRLLRAACIPGRPACLGRGFCAHRAARGSHRGRLGSFNSYQ